MVQGSLELVQVARKAAEQDGKSMKTAQLEYRVGALLARCARCSEGVACSSRLSITVHSTNRPAPGVAERDASVKEGWVARHPILGAASSAALSSIVECGVLTLLAEDRTWCAKSAAAPATQSIGAFNFQL